MSAGTFPALVDGRDRRVFLPGTGAVQVVDTQRGTVLRTVTLPWSMDPPNIQLDTIDARLFVQTRQPAPGGVADAVHMLDARSGQALAILPLPSGELISQLAVDERTRRVFVLTETRHLYVYAALTGRRIAALKLWRGRGAPTPAPGNPADTLVVDHRTGRVIVTESDRATIFSLDGMSGRVRWVTAVRSRADQPAAVLWLPVIDERTEHLVVDDTSTGAVRSLDLWSGRLGRDTVYVNPGRVDMVAVQRTGRTFVFYGGHVSVLDTASGRLVHTAVLGQTYDLEPAIAAQRAGRVLVVNDRTHTLDLLDGASGRVVRAIPLGSVGVFTVDDHSGQVLVTRGTGSITMLDARSGRFVRTLPPVAGPRALGAPLLRVDERTGEVVALTADGASISDRWGWIPAQIRRLIPLLAPPTTIGGATLRILVPAP